MSQNFTNLVDESNDKIKDQTDIDHELFANVLGDQFSQFI